MISRYKPTDSDIEAAREVPIRITQKFQLTKGFFARLSIINFVLYEAGKVFMVHDSLISSPGLPRIIVFSSEEQQKLLAVCFA